MRVIIVIFLTLSLAACGGGSSSGGQQYSSDQLQDALIRLDDLPDGWAAIADSEDPESNDAPCNAEHLFSDAETAGHSATANYSKSAFGPFVYHEVVSLTPEQAHQKIKQLAKSWDCGEWVDADGQTQSIQKMNFKNLGDETIAFKFQTGNDSQLPAEGDYIFIRHGGVISALLVAAVGAVDFDQVQDLAEKASKRMQQL